MRIPVTETARARGCVAAIPARALGRRARRPLAILWFGVLCPLLAHAQPSPLTGLGPAGILSSSARAFGLAGAFIAVTGDPTAGAFNPAGLAGIKAPVVSLTYGVETGRAQEHGLTAIARSSGATTTTSWSFAGSLGDRSPTAASATVPLDVQGRAVVLQASYRQLGRFPDLLAWGVETCTSAGAGGTSAGCGRSLARRSDSWSGVLAAYSLALALQLPARLRAGLQVSYVDGHLVRRLSTFQGATDELRRANYELSDLDLDLGVQWAACETITLGAVYQWGFNTAFDYADSVVSLSETGTAGAQTGKTTVRWPGGFGLGAAWHPSGRLTVAADYRRTRWSDASVRSYRPAQGATLRDAPFPFFTPQGDAESLSLGGEWVFAAGERYRVPLRAGFLRQVAPAPFVLLSATSPAAPHRRPVLHGFSLGVGFAWGRLAGDLAWLRIWGYQDARALGVGSDEDGSFSYAASARTERSSDRLLATLLVRL